MIRFLKPKSKYFKSYFNIILLNKIYLIITMWDAAPPPLTTAVELIQLVKFPICTGDERLVAI